MKTRPVLPAARRAVVLTMADTPRLEGRLRALLDDRAPRGVFRGAVLGAVVGALAVSLPLAALRPAPAQTSPPPPAATQKRLAELEAQLMRLEEQVRALRGLTPTNNPAALSERTRALQREIERLQERNAAQRIQERLTVQEAQRLAVLDKMRAVENLRAAQEQKRRQTILADTRMQELNKLMDARTALRLRRDALAKDIASKRTSQQAREAARRGMQAMEARIKLLELRIGVAEETLRASLRQASGLTTEGKPK